MIDAVASDYQDSINFIAVAGRSDFESTARVAGDLLSGNLEWGLDDSIWDLYDILGQPASVMITGDNIVVDTWYGGRSEDDLRAKFDYLVSLAG